jgi:hypothetical protein
VNKQCVAVVFNPNPMLRVALFFEAAGHSPARDTSNK